MAFGGGIVGKVLGQVRSQPQMNARPTTMTGRPMGMMARPPMGLGPSMPPQSNPAMQNMALGAGQAASKIFGGMERKPMQFAPLPQGQGLINPMDEQAMQMKQQMQPQLQQMNRGIGPTSRPTMFGRPQRMNSGY